MCKGLGEEHGVYVEETGLMSRTLGSHGSFWSRGGMESDQFLPMLPSVCA